MAEKMTRRTFMKSAAAAAAAISLSGVLVGCGGSGTAHKTRCSVGAFIVAAVRCEGDMSVAQFIGSWKQWQHHCDGRN